MTQNTIHEQSPPAQPDSPEAAASDAGNEPSIEESTGWQPGPTWRVSALCVFVLIGLGYTAVAWQLDPGNVDQPGIGMFPRVTGLLFVGCLIPILVREIRAPAAERATDDSDEVASSWGKPLAVLGSVLFYFLTATTLGHIVSGAVAMAVVLRLVGQRRWWVQVGISLACSVVSYLVIAVLLEMPLPAGQLGLEF